MIFNAVSRASAAASRAPRASTARASTALSRRLAPSRGLPGLEEASSSSLWAQVPLVLALGALFSGAASAAAPLTGGGSATGNSLVAKGQADARITGMASGSQEVAIIGGGCFWCVEACYNQMKGVYSAISGYSGGHVANPTYEQVCGKRTGHAEVVKITYDPSIVSYRTILEIFFTIHDPTTKDRQGNDVGPQYRSIIMYLNDEQKRIAEEVMKDVTEQKLYSNPIVTELVPAATWYDAEKYHQRYYENNPSQGYCAYVVGPKVAKFRAKWAKLLS